MREPIKHLQDLGTTITKICEVSGAAGVSIGVIHEGRKYTKGYGFRDVEKKFTPDEDTVYHLASLTKSFTAAAIGILAEEGYLRWNDPIINALPDFHHNDLTIAKKATILDFLSHRTGLATKNALWVQDGAELLLKPEDLYSTVSYLEVVQDLGATWLYNNWGYNLGAEIIEKISNITWGSFLSERIFPPLGLEHTTTEEHIDSENVAKGYLASPDGRPYPIESPRISAGTIMQGANGIKSTVKDLLKYYSAVLSAS